MKRIAVLFAAMSVTVLVSIGCGNINPLNVLNNLLGGTNFITPTLPIGDTWVQATVGTPYPGRAGHRMLTYNNKMWVMTGSLGATYSNDVWSSSTGSNWTLETDSAFTTAGRLHSGAAVFHSAMWVIGGNIPGTSYSNDVWYSLNGSSWTKVGTFSLPRYGHTLLVYNSKLWLIGGETASSVTNDVWYSSDGTNWSCATNSAAFSKRLFHYAVVFLNKMWVINGYTGSGYLNDVWYSTDGAEWTQASAAPFSARHTSSTLVLNERLYVMGGFNGSYLNDVYYTTNGNNWTTMTMSTPFTARSARGCTVFKDKLWVSGGNIAGSHYNDVWSSGD
ncbi:MAG: hypothetical protein AABZ39_01350 [Spirochaetota bacterium]